MRWSVNVIVILVMIVIGIFVVLTGMRRMDVMTMTLVLDVHQRPSQHEAAGERRGELEPIVAVKLQLREQIA